MSYRVKFNVYMDHTVMILEYSYCRLKRLKANRHHQKFYAEFGMYSVLCNKHIWLHDCYINSFSYHLVLK